MLLLGAVSSEMPWLVAVKTISGGWTILHRVVSILPSSLTSVSLGPTQVHWDRYVIKGPGGIGRIKRVVPVGVEGSMGWPLEGSWWGSLIDVLPTIWTVGAGR